MIRHKMERIQSKLNSIEAYDTFKFFCSCFDDKRYGINSLAYFQKSVKLGKVNEINKINEINRID